MISSFLRRLISVLLVLTMGIALGGCNLQLRTEAAQVPQLVAASGTDPKTFNYALSQESPNVFGYLYEGLITENGISGKIEPALAQSWTISEDKQRITFTLRDGLKWSDGEPLTADDVVFTFNDIYFNEEIPAPMKDYLRVGESGALPRVRRLDKRQVEFTVSQPYAPLLRYAGGAPILPAHALRESVKTKDSNGNLKFLSTWGTDTNPAKIIGNGPYRMVSYTTSERVVFRRNPYYWRKDAQGNQLPYIERFVWQIVENTDTSLSQFRSGGVDVLEISAPTFALLKREEERGDFTIYNGGPATSTLFITFNLNKGQRKGRPLVDPVKSRWFNTVAFRQAVAYAIDRQKMINNFFLGLAEPQNSQIPVQSPYYLSPKAGLKVYNYDLEKARQLLLGAGFKYNPRGQLLDAKGNRVRFTLITNSGSQRIAAIGAQVKQDLGKVGIQVDFQAIDFNALLDRISNTFQWDSYLGGITGGVEPHGYSTVWALDGGLHNFNQKPLPGQPSITGQEFADWEREMASLFVKGAQELDEAKRKAIYAESQRISQEYLPFIYLVDPLDLAAVRNRIQGIEYSAVGGLFWNLPELRVAEDK